MGKRNEGAPGPHQNFGEAAAEIGMMLLMLVFMPIGWAGEKAHELLTKKK